jgi:hypothetical protein
VLRIRADEVAELDREEEVGDGVEGAEEQERQSEGAMEPDQHDGLGDDFVLLL